MKTRYQKPELNVILISTEQHMMAGSNGGLLGTAENPNDLDLSNIATTDATSGNMSRGNRSVWGDDEEDY